MVLILLVLWVVATATSHTLGGSVHLLLGVVAALFVVRFVRKRTSERAHALARERRREPMLRSAGRER